jgi:hypothetical protein
MCADGHTAQLRSLADAPAWRVLGYDRRPIIGCDATSTQAGWNR